jgi:hypothetical protein
MHSSEYHRRIGAIKHRMVVMKKNLPTHLDGPVIFRLVRAMFVIVKRVNS